MKPDAKGFTLIELLIALAIFSLVMTAVYQVYIGQLQTGNIHNASAWAQQNVRGGLELMARDIRMAGYDPSGSAGAGIEEISSQKIRVTSDRSEPGDSGYGSIEENNFEKITYTLSGTDLVRTLYEGTDSEDTKTIIENVKDLDFGKTGNQVTIRLEVEKDPGGHVEEAVTRELVTTVYCRNLAN